MSIGGNPGTYPWLTYGHLVMYAQGYLLCFHSLLDHSNRADDVRTKVHRAVDIFYEYITYPVSHDSTVETLKIGDSQEKDDQGTVICCDFMLPGGFWKR